MAILKPVTPGELLLQEFLIPMELTQYRVASEALPVLWTLQRLVASCAGRVRYRGGGEKIGRRPEQDQAVGRSLSAARERHD